MTATKDPQNNSLWIALRKQKAEHLHTSGPRSGSKPRPRSRSPTLCGSLDFLSYRTAPRSGLHLSLLSLCMEYLVEHLPHGKRQYMFVAVVLKPEIASIFSLSSN